MNTIKSNSTNNMLLRITKAVVVFLFIVVGLHCSSSSKNNTAEKRVTRNGNEITFAEQKIIPYSYEQNASLQKKIFITAVLPDSVYIKNQSTRNVKKEAVQVDTIPVAINGIRIQGKERNYLHGESDTNYSEPILLSAHHSLDTFLFISIQSQLNQLNDGDYQLCIKNLVVDAHGYVAYYEKQRIEIAMYPDNTTPAIPKDLQLQIETILADILDSKTKFNPAVQYGKAIPVRVQLGNYDIHVTNHKAKLQRRMGC